MKLRKLFLVAAVAAAGATGYLLATTTGREAPKVELDRSPVADLRGTPAVVSYADSIARIQPAVVSVHSKKFVSERAGNPLLNDPFFRQFFGVPEEAPGQQRQRRREETGLGSGVIVSSDGYILTNNHVIEGADELEVALADERRFAATVVGTDPQTDIAVIKIEAENLPTATLADSDSVRIGDIVFALGNPLGVGQTVTMGIVSAKGRQINILNNRRTRGYEDFIQTDAAINRGNSGGALTDAAGRLIGINSAIISPNMGAGNVGIGFAIPINLAASIMNSLVTTGEVNRGFLGVTLQDLNDDLVEAYGLTERRGAVITDVLEDGPAAASGLRREDVVIAVEGRPIRNVQELRLRIASMLPGATAKLTIVRDRKEMEIDVKLGSLDSAETADAGTTRLVRGVSVAAIDQRTREQFGIQDSIRSGVVVTEVDGESRFAQIFEPGVVILDINGTRVSTPAEARAQIRAGRNRFALAMGGGVRIIAVAITEQER